jgi:hypothetical protein
VNNFTLPVVVELLPDLKATVADRAAVRGKPATWR